MSINFLKNKVETETDLANSPQAEYVKYEDPEAGFGEIYSETVESADFPEGKQSSYGAGTTEQGSDTLDYLDGETEETIYKKSARWILLIGVGLVPLFFLPWTTSILELNKQLLLSVVAGVGLVLWLLDIVMSGKLSWRFNPMDNGVAVFAGAVLLSTIFSTSKFKSLMGTAGSLSDSFLSVAGLTIVYFLVVNLFDDGGKVIRRLFSFSLVVAVIYGLLQMFGVHALSIFRYFDISIFKFSETRAFNTLGSVNALGMTAAVVLPMLYKTNISIFRYFDISRVGLLAVLAVLVILNWWVLWVVAIAGMVAVIALENTTFRSLDLSTYQSFRVSRFLFPMTVIVLGIFLIMVNLDVVFIKANLPIEIAPSQTLSANVAFNILKENPVFGYGPENFSLAFDKYGAGNLKNSSLSGVKFFDATSQALNWVVHNGAVGLAVLGFILLLIGWLLFKKISICQNIEISSENIGVASAIFAAGVAMFFYPFNLSLVFIFYLLLALMVLSVYGERKIIYDIEKRASLSLIASLGFIGGLILALVGLYFVSVNYVADIKYAQALTQKKSEDSMQYVTEAINWKGDDDRFYRLSSQLALVLLSQELNTSVKKDDGQRNSRIQNHLSSAVALAQKATQIAPRESVNWANLGDIYQSVIGLVNGADALAESAYIKAAELRPGDPLFYNNIGNMYLVKADLLRRLAVSGGSSAQQFNQQIGAALLKAEDAFKKAIELSNSFGLAVYNLGSVYERQGKLNEAIKQLETIAPFNANQPGLAFELGLLYYRANKKDKALEQLQKAVVLFPDYANARWYLALIYEERGELDQAVTHLGRILKIEVNKDNEMVKKKLKELEAGKISIPPAKVLDQKPL